MQKPYTITFDIWNEFYTTQMSGVMNMFGHHLVRYFMVGDAYEQALEHFKNKGNREDLVIK